MIIPHQLRSGRSHFTSAAVYGRNPTRKWWGWAVSHPDILWEQQRKLWIISKSIQIRHFSRFLRAGSFKMLMCWFLLTPINSRRGLKIGMSCPMDPSNCIIFRIFRRPWQWHFQTQTLSQSSHVFQQSGCPSRSSAVYYWDGAIEAAGGFSPAKPKHLPDLPSFNLTKGKIEVCQWRCEGKLCINRLPKDSATKTIVQFLLK